jgi:formate/nitrite transporter FocA (FNT family)
MVGLVVAGIVLKYGTQLADSVGEAYKSYRTWTPLLGYVFQIAALYILYIVSKLITSSWFATSPWAYPLLFLLLALVPTIKVVVQLVNGLEGKSTTRHLLTN